MPKNAQSEVAQSCPTLCNPMDCSPPGSSVHEADQFSQEAGIPVDLFQILKDVLWKCCTQYVSKFGKLSSGHRNGKGQLSFQSQRRAIPKNVQSTARLCSFHTLARLCSKAFKLSFSSTWTEKFQMYKLGFEEIEEPEIKLPTFMGSWRKQENSRKTSASLTTLKA